MIKPRPFLRYPNKVLQQTAAPVDDITDEIREIWNEMIVAMDEMPGVGLAAPQLGILKRLCVVDASDSRGQAIRMANPEILHASQITRSHNEGSPNIPGVYANISRPRAVTVKYINHEGNYETRDFVKLWATSVQHQIDHLDGTLFIDHLSRIKRDMLLKKARKQHR